MKNPVSALARSCASCGFLLAVMAASACTSMAIADTPDAATASQTPVKKKRAKKTVEPSTGLFSTAATDGNVGLVGTGAGGRFGAYPECMSADDATRRTKPPRDNFELRNQEPIEQSKEIPECPNAIWTWVGAGHGSRPVGNVRAPLGVPESRKQRRDTPHSCCYMVPPSPGSPNG